MSVRLIAESLLGATSPVPTASETLDADISLDPGMQLPIDGTAEERIEAAKADWRVGRYTAVPGDSEYIPLPER